MTLAVRLHPVGSSATSLDRQWTSSPGSGRDGRVSRATISILRTVNEDPLSLAQIGPFRPSGRPEAEELATAWSEAQLVADASLLGLAVGIRIALVPERRRWFADSLVIRTGSRLRTGRGYRDPIAALGAIRRSYSASFEFEPDVPESLNREEGGDNGTEAHPLRVL